MQLKRRINPSTSRWATPVTAVVAATAVVGTAAFSGGIMQTQTAGSGPIDATVQSASFNSGTPVTVDDPAIAAQGEGDGPRAVQEFRRDEQFSMFALTWTGDQDINAFVRAEQADGSWGPWYEAPAVDTPESGAARNGTDIIYIEPTNAVQVNVHGVDLFTGEGELDQQADLPQVDEQPAADVVEVPAEQAPAADAPAEEAVVEEEAPAEEAQEEAPEQEAPAAAQGAAPLPTNYGDITPVVDAVDAGLEAVFVDGNAQEGGIDQVVDVTSGMPNVISRAGWGANEGIRCGSTYNNPAVKGITLHHTAGSNNYSPAQAASIMRGMYQYHAQKLGWCDIGYNAVVDKYGKIYEGRRGGLDKNVQGAHVGGFNSETWGVSMMGNYETAQPTQALLNGVAEIAGWRFAVAGVDPTSMINLRAGSFGGSKYRAGTTARVNAFHGHGDLHYNACPGRYAIAQWPTIRQLTKAKYDSVRAGGVRPVQPNPVQPNPVNPNPPVTAPRESQPPANNAEAGGSSALGVDAETISTLVGVAAAVGTLAIAAGAVTTPDANQEVAEGVTMAEAPAIISQLVNLSGDPELAQTWGTLLNAFGPLLGLPVGGPNFVAPDVMYQLFDNGVVIDSPEGVHALIGVIAKVWAERENFERLGLPLTNQYETGQGKAVRVDFQGGYITFNPETQKVDVFAD